MANFQDNKSDCFEYKRYPLLLVAVAMKLIGLNHNLIHIMNLELMVNLLIDFYCTSKRLKYLGVEVSYSIDCDRTIIFPNCLEVLVSLLIDFYHSIKQLINLAMLEDWSIDCCSSPKNINCLEEQADLLTDLNDKKKK